MSIQRQHHANSTSRRTDDHRMLRGLVFLSLTLMFFGGCDDGSSTSSSKLMEQLIGKPKPEPIEVGVLFSQTGSMSLSEMPLKHAVVQAIDEINSKGGVLGRPLVPVIRDGRSREDLFAKRAQELLDSKVSVIFGGWRSIDRKAMVPVIEQSGALLFYPLQYEGNESSRNVFYGGMTPNQQILPALDWFMSPEGGSRKRVFLIGTDYVFPRTASYIVKKYLEDKGMKVVGELYVPSDHKNFEKEFTAIRETQADLILSTINGEPNISFFRTFSTLGFDAQTLPIFATSIGETGLRSIPARYTTGHYASWSFFQSLKGKASEAFVARFQKEYGFDRPVHDPMESAYTQVYLWREAVEKAGSLSTEEIRKVLEKEIQVEGPGGAVRIDPRNHHLYKTMRLGRIRDNQQFEIVYESPDLIRPEPYPSFAFPGWSCDWTKGGLQKGPPVKIDN